MYFETLRNDTLEHFEDGTVGHIDRDDCILGHKGFLARPLMEDDTWGHLEECALGHKDRGDCTLGHKRLLARPLMTEEEK